MFNIIDYVTNFYYNDLKVFLVFLIQFIFLPLSAVAGIAILVKSYNERTKQKDSNN
jgi:hypothetical protein